MPFVRQFVVLFIFLATLSSATAGPIDDYVAASSRAPVGFKLCGTGDDDRIKPDVCKQAGYAALVAKIDSVFAAALAKAPASVKPLLKRDEVWFNEMIGEAADTVVEMDDDDLREALAETLRQRSVALDRMADGFGRPGIAGKWRNAFGSVTATAAEGGAISLAFEMRADYGTDRHYACKLTTLVKPGSGPWLAGSLPAETGGPAQPSIRIRRQGDTLRIVLAADNDAQGKDRADCDRLWQITGSYFGEGKADSGDVSDTSFVAPSFDCTRPDTATEEEICADPDLADNDLRLNKAWKALLPRLDDTTRRALTEDQRNWVRGQATQYPEFLHPGWEKQTTQVHYTTDARDRLDRLQRERVALLEGFDDRRSGLAGLWLGYNAVLKVTANADGSLQATGWKWEQGDWKSGCDFDIKGRLAGGVFRSDSARNNPDTLERDHATLIVNRLDDALAKKRQKPDGSVDDKAGEAKCRRTLWASSTARLFPARPSPDIDNLGSGSIR